MYAVQIHAGDVRLQRAGTGTDQQPVVIGVAPAGVVVSISGRPDFKKRLGIDVIGDFLTEVNVTSPTGIRELDKQFDLNIAGLMFDAIYASLK